MHKVLVQKCRLASVEERLQQVVGVDESARGQRSACSCERGSGIHCLQLERSQSKKCMNFGPNRSKGP